MRRYQNGDRVGLAMSTVGLLLILAFWMFSLSGAFAQSKVQQGASVSGQPINRGTKNVSLTIATGGTFQVAIASTAASGNGPRSLTVQNNNTGTTENCWVYVGTTPTIARSIRLLPGGSYTRYWPFIPSDDIRVTCDTNGSTVYVDYQ